MKNFSVQLGYASIVQMEVKANNRHDAIYKARKKRSKLYDSDYEQWKESIIEEIEPWEDADTAEETGGEEKCHK